MDTKNFEEPRVFCDMICGRCGGQHIKSGFNRDVKKFVRMASKEGWRFAKGYGNICPECLEELAEKERESKRSDT